MKFQFEKLGNINKAELELGDLTIICGKNNTGKTYVSYAIYGFLMNWHKFVGFEDGSIPEITVDSLLKNGKIEIDLEQVVKKNPNLINRSSQNYLKNFLHEVFSVSEDYFAETSFQVSFNYQPNYSDPFILSVGKRDILKAFKDKDSPILEIALLVTDGSLILTTSFLKDFLDHALEMVLLEDSFASPFIITAERIGISLFYRELDISKNVLVEQLQKQSKKLEIIDFFKMIDDTVSRYAHPIQNNIDFLRDVFDIHSKKTSPLLKEHPEFAKDLKNLLGGEIKVINDQIFFVFKQARKNQIIPLYLSSSTVKSLLDLNFYIKHIAKKGDILFIDEPELNLHPANQRKMARLFVRLIKAGIKVFITTHSDYIIKELNNLIILGNEFEERDKTMKKYKYTEADVLDPASVKVYIAENQTLTPAPIDNLGIEVKSFDKEIEEMKNMFDDMTETMEIAYEL
ncbi:MAG: AAA family ATPase [Thioploca sp.]|nr:AAA family ATPase [Thioploca sp.]